MGTVTFDTLKLVDTLEQADIPRAQARAIVDVVRESRDATDGASKRDVRELRMEIKNDIRLLQWMVTATLAGVGVILTKLFLG